MPWLHQPVSRRGVLLSDYWESTPRCGKRGLATALDLDFQGHFFPGRNLMLIKKRLQKIHYCTVEGEQTQEGPAWESYILRYVIFLNIGIQRG